MAIETTGDAAGLTAGSHAAAPARIAGNTRANVKGLWFFAVLWNLVSAPVLVYIPPELARQPLGALGFVFPVAGVGLLLWAATMTARARRFGTTWLDTTSAPARPGGTWQGAVATRLPRPEGDGYTVHVKLTCLSRALSRHGSERDERETILWREETKVPSTRITFGGDSASIPVRFEIPSDALITTAVGKGAGILWVLTVEAALPGVNLKEDFDLPVRATGATVASAHEPGLRLVAPAPAITPDDLASTGITIEPFDEGTRFTFGRARNLSFAIGVSAVTSVFVGGLWLQLYLGFPWIFPILTGLVDLLLVYIVIELWLGVTVVTAGNGTLRVRSSIVGAGSSRTLLAAEIAAIELHISMQTQGRYGTPYYQVRARLKSGRKASLGSGIRNKRHAEWLAAQMRTAVGLK